MIVRQTVLLLLQQGEKADDPTLVEVEVTDLHATLDKMDADELRQVQKRVEGLIADYQDRERREAVAAAELAAKERGFKLADLFGGGKPDKGGKAAASRSSPSVRSRDPEIQAH